MKRYIKYVALALVVLTIVALAVWNGMSAPAKAVGTTYYVDCSAGSNGNGSQSSPWNNLATVNGTTFAAGDQILFKRGTTCVGQLYPKGSGASGSPITISAYDSGARPIIDGNNAVDPVVQVVGQNYWTFDNLEIKNSLGKGIYVGGAAGADLYGFTLTNLYVHHCGIHDGHDAVIVGMYQNHSVHNVLIDNVVAHNAFRGIETGGKCCNTVSARSSDIIIRNSTVYNTENDGLLAASSNNILVENVVGYNTGIQPAEENHTPNGIWNWDTDNATFQFNEAYESHSPTWDGGGFDIDYFSHNTTYQYNYGHDNDAYCISIFGGDSGDTTTNNVIRYNICSNDARDASYLEKRQGGIYITVWSRGNIADSYIYNNTMYWNPAAAFYAVKIFNLWHGSDVDNTNLYNNIFYSASPKLVYVNNYTSQTHMDYNLYWYTGSGNPEFIWGSTYTSFSAFQSGSGQEAHGLYANPLLNDPTYHSAGMPTTAFTLQGTSPAINAGANLVTLGLQSSMGSRDFFGNSIPNGAYDIGANEYGGVPQPTNTPTPVPPTNTPTPVTPTNTPGGPTNTPVPPTNTPVPPTATNTPTGGCNGTTNIALNKSTTTSSVQSGDVGAYAVDGNTSSRWWTLKGSTLSSEWIKIDLGSSQNVCKVSLLQDDRYATGYTIQVSTDGSNWSTVATESAGARDVWKTYTFSAVSARYVMMNSTVWYLSTDRVKLNEIQVYQP